MADLTNLPERGVPGTHLSVRHAPDAIAALRASIARQNLTIGVDAVTGDVTLYLNSAKTTYITFVTATGATQLVVLGVDRGSLEGGALGDKDFQESVLDRFDPTAALPVAPTEGDRYIATATANGWTDTYIYTYNSLGAWDELIPTEGATVEVEDENVYYSFNGTAWVRLETLIAHNLLAALQGGTATEYYHLTAAEHAALTILSLEGVIDRLGAQPGAPADWDAYIATATAGDWTINNCYVWGGAAWIEIVPTEGLDVFVADEDLRYAWDGAAWGILQAMDAGAHDHGAATGAGDSHTHPITGPSGTGTAAVSGTFPNHSHGITGPSGSGVAAVSGTFPNHAHAGAGDTGAGSAHSHSGAALNLSVAGNIPAAGGSIIVAPIMALITNQPNPGTWLDYNPAVEPALVPTWDETVTDFGWIGPAVGATITGPAVGIYTLVDDDLNGLFTAAHVGKVVVFSRAPNAGFYGTIVNVLDGNTLEFVDDMAHGIGAAAAQDFTVIDWAEGDCEIDYLAVNGTVATAAISALEIEAAALANGITEAWAGLPTMNGIVGGGALEMPLGIAASRIGAPAGSALATVVDLGGGAAFQVTDDMIGALYREYMVGMRMYFTGGASIGAYGTILAVLDANNVVIDVGNGVLAGIGHQCDIVGIAFFDTTGAPAKAEGFDLLVAATAGFAFIEGVSAVFGLRNITGAPTVFDLDAVVADADTGLIQPSAAFAGGPCTITAILTIDAVDTGKESAHTHPAPATTATDGGAAIAVSDAGHDHTVPAATDTDAGAAIAVSDAGHDHTVPAATDAEAIHTHSITSAGDHAHDVGV